MKKWILFMSILFGIGINSYGESKDNSDMSTINRVLIKEMTYFYGGYKNIYSEGVNKDNIIFIMNEIDGTPKKALKYDFDELTDGQVIKLKLDENLECTNISNLNKLKVVGKSYENADVDLKKEDLKLEIFLSSIGEYDIACTDKKGETKVITLKKESNFVPENKNLDENIENSYKDNDVEFLNKNLTLLKVFYPDSEKIREGLFYALDLNEKNEKYEEVRKISMDLVKNYELDEKEKEDLIEAYLNSLDKLGEKDKYLEFLERLSNYDKKYEGQYLEAAINYEMYTKKSITLAEREAIENPNSKIFKYLGDYYYHLKNYRMAINYYEKGNNIEELAMVYLEIGDKRSFEKLKNSASRSQLKKIKEVENRYNEKQKIDEYFGTAEQYVKEGRYQEAELFYKRILKKGVSYNLKNDIYYKLVDIYYKLNEFELAKEELRKIDSRALEKEYLGNYYYLGGMVYYQLKDYDTSSIYFRNLVNKFPNTPLSNRGKIYLLRIKKIKK